MGRQRPGSIPKGLRPPAQGCEARATLGNASTPDITTPTGLRHPPVVSQPRAIFDRINRMDRIPNAKGRLNCRRFWSAPVFSGALGSMAKKWERAKEFLTAENAKNTKAVFLTGLTGWTGFLTGKIRNEFARMGRQRPGSIPKGIASSSPGLRGTSYPGKSPRDMPTPKGLRRRFAGLNKETRAPTLSEISAKVLNDYKRMRSDLHATQTI